MDKNGLLIILLFLFMIVVDGSNALNSRKLVTTPDPNGRSNAIQDSPLPSPLPNEKKANLSPVEATKPKDTPMTNPSDVESKGLNGANTETGSENSSDKKLDKGKSQEDKEKVENRTHLKAFASKSCKGNPICSDQDKTMIACIQDFENGSNKLTLLVQNKRDITLKVNITFATSMKNSLPAFEIPGNRTEKVNITFSGDKSTKVILNAGNGNCELPIDAPKTMAVEDPSKPKDVDNPSKHKDVDDPVKPKDVDNPADSPAKPKDVDSPAKGPARAGDVDNPAKPVKSKEVDDPSKPKEADSPAKPKEVNGPTKSPKDVDAPAKSKDVDDPAKSKDMDNASKPKAVDKPSKPKEVSNPSKPKDDDDPSRSKGVGPPPKSESVDVSPKPTSVDTPIPQSNLLNQLSFYSKQVTPMYGAYFAFLAALVIGGSWAFCSFRKRRTDGGVQYQELEMGLPESSHAVDVETADGWDQDWDDDDWDEDKAIRSPGGGIQTKTLSSNGLTSRATKKDGWDADWDD